ncbi:hypothetical protein Q7C36_001863 [Tachysurus vachellii]|uniref:SEA domain-containing protein n=1 Tax=Tachysurus vachellii TaxID=175792 RepID=A0AA88NRT9_TACVA|nr:hypothetical protein Q7C36_001863 [Tachysurus vachellii]
MQSLTLIPDKNENKPESITNHLGCYWETFRMKRKELRIVFILSIILRSPTVDLSVGLKTEYTTQLSDPTTPEFKSLAAQVTQLLNQIYTILFGSKYRGCRVKAFRPQPIRAVQNTDADVELIFDENSTTPIPSGQAAATALKEAVDNNSTLSAQIDSSAITVLNQPIDVIVLFVTNGTFTAALSNTSSDSFTTRTLMIKNGLNPFFTQDFPNSFSLLTMLNYSTGTFKAANDSILNSMDLAFNSSAGNPNTTQIAETMFRAAKSGTLPFQISITSITVNGTVFNSGDVSSKISVLMACFMVAVSLLLTRSS